MSFGENLQYLRKRQNMTQDQLAEKFSVSRQTVSKWESDSSYPEMDKILQICDLFHCDMDTLCRGDISRIKVQNTYDVHMNWFTKMMCTGVALVLFGVTVLIFLMAIGLMYHTEVLDAVGVVIFLAFVAAAVMFFVIGGIRHSLYMEQNREINPAYSQEEVHAFQKRFPWLIAFPIFLIFLGLIALVAGAFLSNENEVVSAFLTSLFLLFITCAVPIFVYAGIQDSKYRDAPKEAKNPDEAKAENLTGALCSCIMLIATAAFLLMGFLWGLWYICWVVFPIGGILCGIITTIINAVKR